jgi:hypothetical protein
MRALGPIVAVLAVIALLAKRLSVAWQHAQIGWEALYYDMVAGARRLEDLGCDVIVHHIGYDERRYLQVWGRVTASEDGWLTLTPADLGLLTGIFFVIFAGCQIPIGALAHVYDAQLVLHGFVGSLDGRDALRGEEVGGRDDPATLGRSLAAQLLGQGADSILRHIREHDPLALPGASPCADSPGLRVSPRV